MNKDNNTPYPLHDLEQALKTRVPLVAERLQPGLAEAKIRKMLEKGGAKGAIEPLVHLYSWKNGTKLGLELASSWQGVFPGPVYYFTELDRSIDDLDFLNQVSVHKPKLAEAVNRYFPFLWNGAVRFMALDIAPAAGGRIMLIDTDAEQPIHEAYKSFADLIADIVRANRENTGLACFRDNQ